MIIPIKGMEFISQGSTLRFQVQGSRFRVYRAQGSGSRSWGLGCRIYLGFRAQDFTLYLNPQMSCLVAGAVLQPVLTLPHTKPKKERHWMVRVRE